jgi:hypothetical protein
MAAIYLLAFLFIATAPADPPAELICFRANWTERFTGQDFGKSRDYERELPKFICFEANWTERFTGKDFQR